MPRNKVRAKAEKRTGELKPIDGWQHFDKYITRKARLYQSKEDQPIEGAVILSFNIDREGRPINIKVEKPLCGKCDEEAISLLEEGPKWKGQKGKKGKVVIHFESPERK